MEDAQALVRLIPRLRRYARALTGSSTAADDLVQDTLERACSRLHLVRPGTDTLAWLFTMMHDAHERRANQVAPSNPPQVQSVQAAEAPPQEERLPLRDLERAIGELGCEQREVLMLVCVEGFKYEQVAHVLGIPMGTVMSRLSRAREKLRVLLENVPPRALKAVK